MRELARRPSRQTARGARVAVVSVAMCFDWRRGAQSWSRRARLRVKPCRRTQWAGHTYI